MLTVEFLGGTRTVTGSSFLVKAGETSLLVDCGLFQGGSQLESRNRQTRVYRPHEIDHLVLTHAHIDHSGLIPKLVKDGFRGRITASRQTLELCEVMLTDSAHIQEMDALWQNRQNRRQGRRVVEPLYTVSDTRNSLKYFQAMPDGERVRLTDDMEVRLQNAGHILGSSIVELWVREGGRALKMVFSGDLGRRGQMLVRDPEIMREADFLFVESTYGDRSHKSTADSEIELLDAISSAVREGEKVIIPAFAVERTQELIYTLFKLQRRGLLPDIPIYLDSPLAIAVTKIFRAHRDCFDEEMRQLIASGLDPLDLPRLTFAESMEESTAINRSQQPAIIIAGSGMCNAGRIKHHLKHNLWRPGASIVFVGYQADGTPGRQIIEGAKKVKLLGESVVVKANIFTIGGFSAHADQHELLQWVSNFGNPKLQVFVVHGEEKASLAFARLLREKLHLSVRVPRFMELYQLSVDGEPEMEAVATHAPLPEAAESGRGLLHTLLRMEKQLKRIKDWVLSTKEDAEALDEHNQRRLDEINRKLEELSRQLVYIDKR
ncbi:MAG: MBL fold metallo-hydrolase [Pseudomonadota bacterium]